MRPQYEGTHRWQTDPHEKHADLHRRAINAFTHGPNRTLRVKWVPSHMKEPDILKGTISREDQAGNDEADKLATLGIGLHKVTEALEQQVEEQDTLVTNLLNMMLDIMDNVHEQVPVRKKEDKESQDKPPKGHSGPRTGQQGEHNLIDMEGGGWK
eukprot:14682461-Heterocapsa_arctica.AAC.1